MTTLTLRTARVTYRGADRLDITRKTADPVGVVFAPSWDILRPALALREISRETRNATGLADRIGLAERIENTMWELYASAYRAEMRLSYREHRATWDAVLARRGTLALVCFCVESDHCHRTLAAKILVAASRGRAVYEGEVAP